MAVTNMPEETGLGYLDSSKAILELEMEIKPLEEPANTSEGSQTVKRRGRKKAVDGVRSVVIPISIQQDLGMLKGRTGDTGKHTASFIPENEKADPNAGSVLWRSR